MTGPTLREGSYALLLATLAGNWWAIAIRGALGILFGLIALFQPGTTILSLVLLFGAYALADGVFGIVSAVRAARHGQRWSLLVLDGLVSIGAAAVALLWPGITVIAFISLIAAWAILSGVLMLGAAFRLGADDGRGWLALTGVLSVIYGALLIVAPISGAVVLTWWIGAYAIVFGIALVVLAFRLRARLAHIAHALSAEAVN